MEQTSIKRLNNLHPKLREKALAAYAEAVRITPVGVHPYITQTMRTFEESDALYAQGRTTKGSIVTNAKGGQSYHNYGLAIDFVNQVNGKTPWIVDANWMKVINVFKKHGFVSGNDFRTLKDAPHFEMSFGYTVKQLKAKWDKGDVFIQNGIKYVNL